MFFRYDNERDASHGHDQQVRDDIPRMIGGERVETLPAPQTLVEHYQMERLLHESDDVFLDRFAGISASSDTRADDADGPLMCEAVVSARLLPAQLRMVEILELSGRIDASVQPYEAMTWLKVRQANTMCFIVHTMVCIAMLAAALLLAIHVTQLWQIGALVVFLITAYLVSRQFILNKTITVSDWYKMSYSSWRELVKCMVLWNHQGVSQNHIYRRTMSFIEDVAVKD